MNAGRRAGILAFLPALAAALILAAALWPVLGPLTQRAPVPPAVRWTGVGVPVPAAADRCGTGTTGGEQSVRWCLPGGTAAASLARWYARVLPAGRDTADLQWCLEQWLDDGSRRALWSTGAGLVGYVLPPGPGHPYGQRAGGAAVAVVDLPGTACPPAARASRWNA